MFRVPVDAGSAWFKVCAPHQAFEVPLTAALWERWPGVVTDVIAHDEQLTTVYGHLQPHSPKWMRPGAKVKEGCGGLSWETTVRQDFHEPRGVIERVQRARHAQPLGFRLRRFSQVG